MQRIGRSLVFLSLVTPLSAFADDTNPKPPNVLLLIDDSGSMAWKIDSSSYPSCGSAAGAPNTSAEKSRWALLVEALTGTINGFGCASGSSSTAGAIFSNYCSPGANADADSKFAGGSVPLYGWPLSSATSGLPAQARDPINFPHYKKSGSSAITDGTYCAVGPGGWDQSADGVIDTFGRQMRFGLMTFDDDFPRFTDNASSALLPTAIPVLGLGFYPGSGAFYYPSWQGGYSYWYDSAGNWKSGALPHRGAYARGGGSATTIDWEVGARNPNARPWEGRLMGFGGSDDPNDFSAQNDRVQLAILGLHPFTGTPLAGLLSDADDFIVRDDTTLTNYPTTGKSFLLGPSTDPANNLCRETDIVLVTDGAPNVDMRSTGDGGAAKDYLTPGLQSCDQPGGSCPYRVPGYYAADLLAHGVKTHVIGLAATTIDWKAGPGNCPAKWASNPKSVGAHCVADCSTIDASDYGPSGTTGKMCAGTFSHWDHASDPGGFDDPSQCCELANVALNGGTKAYFPSNVNDIKSTFAQLLSNIAGGSTSRTVPTFATAAPTVVVANNPQEPTGVAPSSYEILSSLEVQVGNAIWGGHIERRRLSCDGTSHDAVALDIDASKGDSFDTTMAAHYGQRLFFTTVAESSAGRVLVDQSLRRTDLPSAIAPVSPNTDGLGSVDVSKNGNQTVADKPAAIDTRIDARLTKAKSKDVLGIDWTTASINCQNLLGVTGSGAAAEQSCAKKTFVWFGGGKNGLRSDRIPDAVNCPKCNPLGAIYHATPVTVGPPVEGVRDESYRNDFSIAQRFRPTMTYAATLDGQLHAFVLENNAPSSDATYGATPHTDSDGTLNELWTFFPPTVLPSIWPNFNSDARLLDGALAVADVIPFRTYADAEDGTGTWKTILVGASGESAAGGFYYALDVTNPLAPEFLWQLRTDGAGNALFGKSVPGAAIATIALQDAFNATRLNQVAVAILPGGAAPGAAPTTTRARRCGCSGPACAPCDPKARSTIRDWGDSVPARSVTVVELATGRILKRFVGSVGPSPAGDMPAITARAQAGFDSPMTGIPVAFPNGPAVVASRAYVGDADGTLWRLDLSGGDPSKWSASIAADIYGTAYTAKGSMAVAALAGQPIEGTPILSTDVDENPVVMFATGSQEGFSNVSSGMRNYLVSMVDRPAGGGKMTSTNAVVVEMAEGERVTGPMSLFAGKLFFSSYVPSNASACALGQPRIWGIDYLTDTSAVTPAGTGPTDPANGLDTNGDGSPDKRYVALDPGAVVFGVAINRLPSCVTTQQTSSDAWLAGTYSTGMTDTGKYELVFQTGKGSSASALGGEDLLSAAGNGQGGAKANSIHIDLPTPAGRVHVESWTSIVE